MYRAKIIAGASLEARSSAAFNFGTHDFTVMAMLESRQGGTVVARKGTAGGTGNGGFLLVVNPDGSVKFATDNGFGYFQVVTGPTRVLDGACHTIAGIRSGARLSILLDGVEVPATPSGNAAPPLNVNNYLPLTIGRTQQGQEPHNQFIGAVMNVSLWNLALSGDMVVKAAFARIAGDEPELRGYWALNGNTQDRSRNTNMASIVGSVSFEYCLDCVWAQASNHYAFCQIENKRSPSAPVMNVTLSHAIYVPAGATVFGMAIMADQDTPAFPVGAQVTLSDPSGVVYRGNQNTNTVCAVTSGGQLWALMVINPAVGLWHVTVTAPATSAFSLKMQTIPTAAVVQTSRQALDPLFNTSVRAASLPTLLLSSWWDVVAAVAVGVVVGAVAAAVVVYSGGTALPAVAAAIGAFAVVEGTIATAVLPAIDSGNLPGATVQVAGMAGFIVAADKLLILDANVAADQATQRIYRQRKAKLYPKVTASPFSKVQSQLVGNDMNRVKVRDALLAFSSGYVTACGHGLPGTLFGWYVPGSSDVLEEVISNAGTAKFDAAEVRGKIIHFFACNTGDPGTPRSPGLGRAMVAAGAVAFLGYKLPFIIDVAETPAFCACDIKIDLAMITGATCEEAHTQAIALYNSTISTLRANANPQAAARLESNRDALVSPSTDPMYGDKTAHLK